MFFHADWNPITPDYDADISLLEFGEGKIYFNTLVQPICLWVSENEPTTAKGIVTGWRKRDDMVTGNVLQVARASIETNGQCLPGHGQLAEKSSERTFCVGLQNDSSVCTGNNGGSGLFIQSDGVFYLKGIVSSTLDKDDPCNTSRNAVYTNVLKFREWIEAMTGIAVSSSTKGW